MPGYIERRSKDSFRLVVSLGSSLNGKPVRKTKTIKGITETQAKKELAIFYAACESGSIDLITNSTVSSFSDLWMQEYAMTKLKKTTILGYKKCFKNYIVPELGTAKLSKIRPLHAQEFINLLTRKYSLSPKSVRNVFFLLSKMFDTAIRWEFVSSNPCVNVILPPTNKKEADYYNADELALLFSALDTVSYDHFKYKVAVMLAIFSGIRLGELMGLMWSDVNFEKCMISIERARMHEVGVGSYIDTPKTKKSVRKISIPFEILSLLRELRKRQYEEKLLCGTLWANSEFIMLNDMGAPMYKEGPSGWFNKFLKANNLKHISFHQLRHTHATILHSLNVDMLSISKRLGHSQLSTTQNVYTHLFNDYDTQISDKMSDAFFPSINKKKSV